MEGFNCDNYASERFKKQRCKTSRQELEGFNCDNYASERFKKQRCKTSRVLDKNWRL